ncbi:uncharacterized protein LTR77_006206 [Saxophila tyrrhenica]|uniref:Uncharacterized protein n=1 Tax=Saxophila tyrrhenica TaxID=1690608 RepID=A0AAV9P7U6_9PEZI|nr:hypothetical protein LTR77_006206 [Saxophila tyrrhenica]
MAFQQPQQRPAALRQVSSARQTSEQVQVPASPARKRTIEESQEWILFSPAQNDEQSRTSQTPRTATQLSDFGSLETHIRSQPIGDNNDNDLTCQGTEVDDDGAELDSLDDGLHAFHHNPFSTTSNNLDQSGGTVLPMHDGFGSFPSYTGLQEHLWQFERHNPQRKRHVRRRSSVQKRLDALDEEQDVDVEDERTARIEKWRLEQSRAVLDEIEKETRRRRRRMSRMSGASASMDLRGLEDSTMLRAEQAILEEPEQESKSEEQSSGESFWQRITRRVIRDLIGLDENTLSVIFGESLPDDASPTPTQPSPIALATASPPQQSRVSFLDPGYSWEVKLLDHIARELGVLVHQLTEHDGRAFNTYLSTLSESPSYAGLPARDIPPRQPSLRQQRPNEADRANPTSADPIFNPTLSHPPYTPTEAPDSSLWGIEEEPTASSPTDHEASRAYWERSIDVSMIFTYLRRRFSSHPPPPNHPSSDHGPLPASWTSTSALGTSPESLRRAEAIRRQHPLVSRAADRAAQQSRRRDSLLRRHQLQQIALKRAGSSSCASQSTKRSRRSGGGSSRHFWDLGGSVGSVGSGHAMSSGGLGGWGEV